MISLRRLPATTLFEFVTLTSIGVLALLLLVAPPDGTERAQLMQFIGRFHPLAVHLPIALLIFVPVLEIVGKRERFSYLLPACPFVLGVAIVGAIVAALLGWCLGRNGGYSGPLVTQHMWSAILVAAGAWLCWRLRIGTSAPQQVKMYYVSLIVTVAIVAFAGYRGGQLSLGENHLTEHMPAPLAALLGVSNPVRVLSNSANGGPGTFYGAWVQPIFAKNCVSCHGRNKHKSNLRLDSFEAVMHGGKHGLVIKAGDSKDSELFRRITLPASDHDFMPSERQPLGAGDVKYIEQWIMSGASGTLPASAIHDAGPNPPAIAEVSFEDVDSNAVATQRAPIATIVEKLQRRLPNVIDYRSRGSSEIVVNAAWMQSKFGDDELAELSPLATHIVTADFSNTSITDKSAAGIAAMTQLRILRLMHTRISDESVRSLGALNELESLSLFDTPVTSAALSTISRLPKLQHVYVSGTKISSDAKLPNEIAGKLVF